MQIDRRVAMGRGQFDPGAQSQSLALFGKINPANFIAKKPVAGAGWRTPDDFRQGPVGGETFEAAIGGDKARCVIGDHRTLNHERRLKNLSATGRQFHIVVLHIHKNI